ncbi:MAG TPA: hypothetical protein VLB86_04995 [Gaiellaceae bacterium]|nr:hypothetical protein [Gaiellaceae bacterium]
MARRRLVASVIAAALIGAPSALAASPGTALDGYGGEAGGTQGGLAGQQGGVLPFTGVQLGLVTLGGIALIGSGVALRRSTRPDR